MNLSMHAMLHNANLSLHEGWKAVLYYLPSSGMLAIAFLLVAGGFTIGVTWSGDKRPSAVIRRLDLLLESCLGVWIALTLVPGIGVFAGDLSMRIWGYWGRPPTLYTFTEYLIGVCALGMMICGFICLLPYYVIRYVPRPMLFSRLAVRRQWEGWEDVREEILSDRQRVRTRFADLLDQHF